jgi:hypothetical protein
MSLWPSKQQWRQWSLPSKLTAIGALVGALSLGLYGIEKAFQLTSLILHRQTPKTVESNGRSPEIMSALKRQEQSLNEIKERLKPLQNTSYRELVATVIHSFEPKADIKVGSWVQGPDGARNIDIEVRSVVDGKYKLMAIEVVDLPGDRKVGVETIDAIDSKRADLQADIAVVCSNTGFDAIAIRKAKRKRIGLISVLRQGDPRVKALIEEELYLRKVHLGSMQFNYAGDNPPPDWPPNLEIQIHDLQYQGKSVDAWLQQRAAIFVASQPELSQPMTLKFDLKTATEFEIKNHRVYFHSLSITFYSRTQWLSQVVRFDALTGIYDYLRGRVRLAGGKNSYMIHGVDFDSATPLSTPPALQDFGVGLFPGEVDFSLTMVEGLNLPAGMEIPKLEDIVRPEDLKFQWPLSGTSAMPSSVPRNTKQSP